MICCEMEPVRDGQGFEELPARVVGAAGVADLTGADQILEGAQGFVEGREGVEVVGLVEIDVIGSKTAETRFAGFQNVAAREAGPVGAGFEPSEDFRRQDDVFAARAQCLAEHFLRLAERVDVGRVEQVHARIDTDFNLAPRLLHLYVAHRGEPSFAAQRHGAKAQRRNFQPARA